MAGSRSFRIKLISPVVAMALSVIVLTEGALRLDVLRELIPEPKPYYRYDVEKRLRALKETIEHNGRIDCLFIGNSVVRTNFQPFTFDSEIFEKTGLSIVSFNGGLSDLTPDAVKFYLQHFYLKHLKPKIIFQGVRYPDLKSTALADKYEPFKRSLLEQFWIDQTLLGKIKAIAYENIQLLYYKGLLTPQKYLRRSFVIDKRGYNTPGLTLPEAKKRRLLIDPRSYKGSISADDFQESLSFLKATYNMCMERGISYILVNIPEHGDKFSKKNNGARRYSVYLNQLKEYAKVNSIIFVDVTNGNPNKYSNDIFFSDYHHMSAVGAEKFTKELASVISKYLIDIGTFNKKFTYKQSSQNKQFDEDLNEQKRSFY